MLRFMPLLVLVPLALQPQVEQATARHEAGVQHHLRRSLDDASAEYEAALALDPPSALTAAEREVVLRLTPRLFVQAREPFGLKDAAAVMHPVRPIIAYHLFWDDDVDFPDDNDPCDHEVVWIEYARGSAAVARITTLFHGRIVTSGDEALADARAHDMRARIDVQWGKHGPMPAGWQKIVIATQQSDTDTGLPEDRMLTLLEYNELTWKKLSTTGTRQGAHPLARQHRWPSRFEGTLPDFTTMARAVDATGLLRSRGMMIKSRWNSAVLNRRFLLYNFRPKLEWPD